MPEAVVVVQNLQDDFDRQMMQLALSYAKKGAQQGEVPVGAVLTKDEVVFAAAFNQTISLHDATAHAEVTAIRMAGRLVKNYRLTGCTLYTTLEPCVMCAGAVIHARISRLVFGASDPKTGACGSIVDLFSKNASSSLRTPLNHHTQVKEGVLSCECSAVLSQFFHQRRGNTQAKKLPNSTFGCYMLL